MSVFNESGAKIYASAIVTGQQLKSSEMSYALCSMAQYIVSLKGLEAEKQLYIDKLVEDKQKVQLEYETLLDQFKDLNTEGKNVVSDRVLSYPALVSIVGTETANEIFGKVDWVNKIPSGFDITQIGDQDALCNMVHEIERIEPHWNS